MLAFTIRSESLVVSLVSGFASISPAAIRRVTTLALDVDSVLSGRTVEQVRNGEDAGPAIADACRELGAKRSRVAFSDVRPMLATPGEPYVCIGFHQDLEHEIDLEFCRREGLPVVRRETGGGGHRRGDPT